MGVAGGELLIPTIVLLFAVDKKIAGSLALAISLPTTLVAFARYSRDRSFEVLRVNKSFVLALAIMCTILGGLLLGAVPEGVLIPPAGRAPPHVFGHGLAPRLAIKTLCLALLAVAVRGRPARGEPNRAAGHVRRMIPPARRDLTADAVSVLKADVSPRTLPSIHIQVGGHAGSDLA